MTLHSCCSRRERLLSRRQWLAELGTGFGGLALSAMLAEESSGGQSPRTEADSFRAEGEAYHHALHVWRSITSGYLRPQAFARARYRSPACAGATPAGGVFPNRMGNLVGSPFSFRQHGDSGLWISSLFPCLSRRADDLSSSMGCTAPIRDMAVPCSNGIPAAIRSSGPAWVPGSPTDSGARTRTFRDMSRFARTSRRAGRTTSARDSSLPPTRGRGSAMPDSSPRRPGFRSSATAPRARPATARARPDRGDGSAPVGSPRT